MIIIIEYYLLFGNTNNANTIIDGVVYVCVYVCDGVGQY